MGAYGSPGKRLKRDPLFAARMAYCGPRGIALSDFLRWNQRDQEAALAWSAHEAKRCKGCGTHPDDWAEDKHTAYHAHLTECRGCKQLQRLANTDKAKQGDGRFAVMAGGSAADCPRCKPISLPEIRERKARG